MITDPTRVRMRVGSIATHCGFSNDSVFSRAFREAYGLSPSELRDASSRANTAGPDYSQENGFQLMNRWLIGMEAAGR
jgi:AraC-like DNA-binding protein